MMASAPMHASEGNINKEIESRVEESIEECRLQL